MSQYLHLGLSLDQVIECVTATPAAMLNYPEKVGSLEPDSPADVAVLDLEPGRFTFADGGATMPRPAKSTPSNSPGSLRSCSQRCVARSDAGWARHPTVAPTAAVRNAPLTLNSASQGRPAQLVQRPQADLLDADAAGADQAQRVDVDRLHVW